MQTIHASQRTGSDGLLNLTIPTGEADAEFDVVVVMQSTAAKNGVQSKSAADEARTVSDTIRERLRASGRVFRDSVLDIREDRER